MRNSLALARNGRSVVLTALLVVVLGSCVPVPFPKRVQDHKPIDSSTLLYLAPEERVLVFPIWDDSSSLAASLGGAPGWTVREVFLVRARELPNVVRKVHRWQWVVIDVMNGFEQSEIDGYVLVSESGIVLDLTEFLEAWIPENRWGGGAAMRGELLHALESGFCTSEPFAGRDAPLVFLLGAHDLGIAKEFVRRLAYVGDHFQSVGQEATADYRRRHPAPRARW